VRRLLAALLLVLLPSQALAASGPPPGLSGTLMIVAQDASSVTLHAEQMGGEPVTLALEHTCYNADDTAWRAETVRFVGSVNATFSTLGGRFHGNDWIADNCKAEVWFYWSSRSAMFVAGTVVTRP